MRNKLFIVTLGVFLLGVIVTVTSCAARGLTGWLLLLPTIFAYMLHLSLLILVFFLPMLLSELCNEKGGLYRLLGALVSVLVGGITIRLGYWFGIEGFTTWELMGHQFMYPIIGWIYMIAGGLIAIIGMWWGLFRRE